MPTTQVADTAVLIDGQFDLLDLEEARRYLFSTEAWADFYPNTLRTIRPPYKRGDFSSVPSVGSTFYEKYMGERYFMFEFEVTALSDIFVQWTGKIIESPLLAQNSAAALVVGIIEYHLDYASEMKQLRMRRRVELSHPDQAFLDAFVAGWLPELVRNHDKFLDLIKQHLHAMVCPQSASLVRNR